MKNNLYTLVYTNDCTPMTVHFCTFMCTQYTYIDWCTHMKIHLCTLGYIYDSTLLYCYVHLQQCICVYLKHTFFCLYLSHLSYSLMYTCDSTLLYIHLGWYTFVYLNHTFFLSFIWTHLDMYCYLVHVLVHVHVNVQNMYMFMYSCTWCTCTCLEGRCPHPLIAESWCSF